MRLCIAILLFLQFMLLSTCAPSLTAAYPFDFAQYRDRPLPAQVASWLEPGPQTPFTEKILFEARKVSGQTRRERLFKAMPMLWNYFTYDAWLNPKAFERTADDLFRSRVLGGCSDYALAQIALFRALGIPARMVITANVDWMLLYRKNNLLISEGHSFIEVYLEDRWCLVDTTYRWFFNDYDLNNPNYPHAEYFCMRGRDFWDMGIRTIKDLDLLLSREALNYRGGYQNPPYPKYPL